VLMNSFDIAKANTKAFNTRLNRVLADFQRRISANLSALETVSGKAVTSEFNINYATALYSQLTQDLQDAGFDDAVKTLLDGDGKLIKSLGSISGVPLQVLLIQ